MWSEEIENDDSPFLEDGGLAREAHSSEASRSKVAKSISCASCVGIIAFSLMLGWRTFDHSAAVNKVVALSDKGYDCLGKADVLDDMGKQWCCSKGLIPCGEASRLAPDSHDLFSEDLADQNRDLLDAPHFPLEEVDSADKPTEEEPSAELNLGQEAADSADEPIEEEPFAELNPDEDASEYAESGYPYAAEDPTSYSDAPSALSGWHGALYHDGNAISSSPTADWHSDDVSGAYSYPDTYSPLYPNDGHHVVVHHVYSYPGDHFYQPHLAKHHTILLSEAECHAGLHHLEDWSLEMKTQCCAAHQVGCDPMEFHCKETDNWEKEWSSSRKAFCCATTGKGCKEAKFKCQTSSVNQPYIWEKERREWCCLHAKVGCPSYEAPYDCKAGNVVNRAAWSLGKKKWCCDHFLTGCSEERTHLYECKAASVHEIAAWPDLQKAWCCHNEKVGCSSSGHIMAKFDCLEGYFNWQRGWSSEKKTWCCAKANKGCEKHYACDHDEEPHWSAAEKEFCCAAGHCTSKGFDCKAGYDHWKMLWTSAKQDWCCSAYGRGCPSHDLYDCSGISQLHTWSESKIMWCCQHRQAGCGAERQFDCLAGYNNWKQGWSSKKKVFCCDNFQLACEREGDQYDNLEEIAFSVNDEYDCKAGFANWQRGWSDDKKGFCCGKYKIGCPPGWKENQMHFGTHWSSDWSKLDHHVWATAKAEPHESHESQSHEFHESHDGSPQHYDCVTDYEHWKVSWSSKRAKFCCHAYSVACD